MIIVEDKLFVVVAVLVAIFIGIIFSLFRLEKKLKKLEDEIKAKSDK
ncbi:MAG: hypothetical protein Q8880_04665 [Bacteroidota bacterium]|nr:hypothetical protein [Bacteroidota bacterium]